METGRPAYHPSLSSIETLYLRLSQPGAVEPAVRARSRPQCRADVALLGWLVRDHKRSPISKRTTVVPSARCARFVELCR